MTFKKLWPLGLFLGGIALLLTACSDSWTLATRDYATEVAQDNAEAAKTNPFSAVLQGVAGLVASLAGAGVMLKRGIKKYDDAPMERSDGSRVTEAQIADAVPKAPEPPKA